MGGLDTPEPERTSGGWSASARLGDPQKGEGPTPVRLAEARALGDIGPAVQAEETQGEISQRGHDLRACPGSDLRPIFVEGHVPDLMGWRIVPHPCEVVYPKRMDRMPYTTRSLEVLVGRHGTPAAPGIS